MVFSYKRASFLLILSILCLPHYGHSQNFFRKKPQETYYVEQGGNLELPCLSERKNVSCAWMQNNDVIAPDEELVFKGETTQGDCSLTIHNLSFPRHNSTFKCQVPTFNKGGSSYKEAWPTTSVIVMVKPSAPILKIENLPDIPADQVQTLVCESQFGNPLPVLEWTLNGENITANASSTVKGESVTSTLSYTFKKQNNGSTLACVSVHRLEKQMTKKVLNVTYRPIVSVKKHEYKVIEGQELEIDCQVDANPHAIAIWIPVDQTLKKNVDYKINGSKLQFSKINGPKMNDKEFQCSSQNTNGVSETATVVISVDYEPRLVKASLPQHKVNIYDELFLECEFIGNPKPSISFHFVDSIYRQEHSPKLVDSSKLLIHNISYYDEGDYYCEGKNEVDGKTIQVRSQKMVVDVTGKPQFLNSNEPIISYQNTNTVLEAFFCSDPLPKLVEWKYGGSIQHVIDVDFRKKKEESTNSDVTESPHILAGPLVPLDSKSPNPTCFKTALYIATTDISDAKEYTVIVSNEDNKRIEKIIFLQVSNKMSGAMIISISLIALLMLFVLTLLFIFFLRRRSSDQNGQDCENKSDSRVPIHKTDDTAKSASSEKTDVHKQIYANIDFTGSDHSIRQQSAIFTREPKTEYATISFSS